MINAWVTSASEISNTSARRVRWSSSNTSGYIKVIWCKWCVCQAFLKVLKLKDLCCSAYQANIATPNDLGGYSNVGPVCALYAHFGSLPALAKLQAHTLIPANNDFVKLRTQASAHWCTLYIHGIWGVNEQFQSANSPGFNRIEKCQCICISHKDQ